MLGMLSCFHKYLSGTFHDWLVNHLSIYLGGAVRSLDYLPRPRDIFHCRPEGIMDNRHLCGMNTQLAAESESAGLSC